MPRRSKSSAALWGASGRGMHAALDSVTIPFHGGLSMSTAAPTKAAAPQPGGGSGYEVARPLGKCAVTGEVIPTGEKFMAALRETPAGFERVDVSLTAWPKFERKDVV